MGSIDRTSFLRGLNQLYITAAVIVGMEHTVYTVRESDVSVQVCAAVYSPSECSFHSPLSVYLITHNGSASKKT